MKSLQTIVKEAKNCTICVEHLVDGTNPVFAIHPDARIVIIGQAPGRKVHESGIPWDDASGKRLRQWLNVDNETFYDVRQFAILPMGFCFPGTGKSGDLPPRPECAPKWHKPMLDLMPDIDLVLLFGQYAQAHYLGKAKKKTLTETVRNWQEYGPKYLPLPHPSPRNGIWLRKNAWFEEDVLPVLKKRVGELI